MPSFGALRHLNAFERARPNNVGRAQCFACDAGPAKAGEILRTLFLNSVAVCADTYAHARSPETDTAPLLAVTPVIIIALTGRISV
jgi:hypothetical protein